MRVRVGVHPLDSVVAAALTLAAQIEIWAPRFAPGVGAVAGSRPVLAVTSLFITVPLAVRGGWPLAAGAIVFGAAAIQQLFTTPTEGLSTLGALLVAAFTLGTLAGWPRRAAGIGAMIGCAAVFAGADLAFVLVVCGASWGAGRLVAARTRIAGSLRTDNARLIREHREAAERGAADERARIARELHDVVSHHVSMMVVQAQAADALLDSSPDRARQAVRSVDEAGRAALSDLRHMLGLLHSDPPAPEHPRPDLASVDDLVTNARNAGVSVTVETIGTPTNVSAAVAAAVYRVIQESLTNVIKHDGGGPVRVVLEYGAEGLSVLVENDGPVVARYEPGFGLAGMRERITFVGGTIHTGPRGLGGFTVHATVPITKDDP